MRPFSMFDTVDQSAAPPAFGTLRKNQSSEDILRDAQVLKDIPVLRFNGDSICISFRREKVLCKGEDENQIYLEDENIEECSLIFSSVA